MPGAVSEIRGVDAAGRTSRLKVIKGAAKSNKWKRARAQALRPPRLRVDLWNARLRWYLTLESTALFSIFFPMTKVAVGILKKNGKILACQRKRGSRYELKWEFPGGKMEPGETVAQCLERELFEELSIHITRIEDIETQQWHYDDGGTYEVAYCTITDFTGELRNNVFEQVKWVTPAELARLDSLEGNADIVRKLAGQNAASDPKNS